MACCAAAAFFISQIVLAFESVRRRLFGARVREVERNHAVAWTLGTPAVAQPRPKRTHRLIFAALVAEALLIAGSATAWTAHRETEAVTNDQSVWSLALSSICTIGSPDESHKRLTDWTEGKQR